MYRQRPRAAETSSEGGRTSARCSADDDLTSPLSPLARPFVFAPGSGFLLLYLQLRAHHSSVQLMFGAAGRALALLLSAAVLTPSLVRAGAASCSVHVGKDDYDLSALSAVQTFERERDTPPTVMVDRVRMMLCGGNDAGLPHEEGFESVDEVGVCHTNPDLSRPSLTYCFVAHTVPDGNVCLPSSPEQEGWG